MKSSTILLIHPPAASPAMPSWYAAVAAGALNDSGLNPVYYDANLEFFLTHILSKKQAHIHFQMIQKKHRSGKVSNEKYDKLKNIYGVVCETSIDMEKVRKKEFFDPHWFIGFKKIVNSILTLASQAYYPDIFHWGTHVSYEKGLNREFARHDPGTVILFISSPGQRQAAETMAGFIKSRYPETLVLAKGKPGIVFKEGKGFDQMVHGHGLEGLTMLMDIISRDHGTKNDPKGSIPDFRGMPMDKYLMPGPILPVHPLFFKDSVCLSDFLKDQVENCGIQGFVFLDDSLLFPDSDGPGDSANPDDLEQGAGKYSCQIWEQLDHWFSIKDSRTFFSMTVPIPDQVPGQVSDELQDLENKLPDLFSSGLKLIQWEWNYKKVKIPKKILWAASKQGIWNHVTGPNFIRDPGQSEQGRFIVNNPNIVHSYQQDISPGGTIRDFSGDGNTMPGFELMDYNKVQPLAGVPFWQTLEDPVFFLLYLSRLTRKSLGCLRADIPNQSLITLGSQMEFFYQSPSDLAPGILDEICKMVDAGGSVDLKYVRSNLEKAYLIGYAMEDGVILGNSCLKHPRKEFIQRINQITDFDLTHFVERGYTSVRPECRSLGVGARLLEGLTKRAGGHKIFSIISEDNLATHKIAKKNNTRKILTYFSEKVGKKMGIWMPEHMIENEWNLEK
ncbi:MAG: hypothetical protein B6230_00655 [Desulfobacteraceae bacterium 4572_89]|nr:MAG: hypothetical protein B6230_00655 [Desulfobacteraceae bacterium 4572_89]